MIARDLRLITNLVANTSGIMLPAFLAVYRLGFEQGNIEQLKKSIANLEIQKGFVDELKGLVYANHN